MTPLHRSEIIAKIKEDIKNGINTTVISTSLIEAGVDLDFKAVFREIAGIDNILQSGGICNREVRWIWAMCLFLKQTAEIIKQRRNRI